MTKQEQIEEMTKERNEIKDIMKLLDKCVSLNPMYKSEVASVLYGNNYRKLPEDSVVLSREEYKRITTELVTEQRATEIAKEYFEKIRKETAEKILFKFESVFAYYDNEDMFSKKTIFGCLEEIVKSIGVEIKE